MVFFGTGQQPTSGVASDGSARNGFAAGPGRVESRVGRARRGINEFFFPIDPYLSPLVGLLVGLSLLVMDLGAAEASAMLRISALIGSLILITDSVAGLTRAFGRTEVEPEQPDVLPVEEAPVAALTGERSHPGRAYSPPPPPEPVEDTPAEQSNGGGLLPLISLIVAIMLGLSTLGTATTALRVLALATTILISVRLYMLYGPGRD